MQRSVAVGVVYLQIGFHWQQMLDDIDVALVAADLQRRFARTSLIDHLRKIVLFIKSNFLS